jgi:LysM repeat protein
VASDPVDVTRPGPLPANVPSEGGDLSTLPLGLDQDDATLTASGADDAPSGTSGSPEDGAQPPVPSVPDDVATRSPASSGPMPPPAAPTFTAVPGRGTPASSTPAEPGRIVICPYLRAVDGTWRSASPAPEHRCWAVTPSAELPATTQQALCLSDSHTACDAYLAAQERRMAALADDRIAPERIRSARFGPLVASTPIAVERGGQTPELAASLAGRVPGGRLPIALLAGAIGLIALVALVILFGGGRSPGSASASPTPAAASGAPAGSPGTSSQPSGPPSPGAAGSPEASPAASGGPGASSGTRPVPRIVWQYVVQDGDTIKSIAAKFAVTTRDLKAVNDLGDPPSVSAGQTINIPAGSDSTPPPTPAPDAQPTPEVVQTYVVRDGDTLKSIASAHGVAPRDLKAVNDFGEKPTLVTGQIINIPAPGQAAPGDGASAAP